MNCIVTLRNPHKNMLCVWPLFVWFIYIYIYIDKQEYLIYINESKENKDYKDIFSSRYNLKNRNLQGLAFGPSYILIKDKQFITLFPTYNLRRQSKNDKDMIYKRWQPTEIAPAAIYCTTLVPKCSSGM